MATGRPTSCFCDIVGCQKLVNSLTSSDYNCIDLDKKKTSEWLKTNYDLGNNFKTTNPTEAAGFFLRREFREIENCQETPHDVIFVPDVYQYQGLTEKVIGTCLPLWSLKYMKSEHYDSNYFPFLQIIIKP